MGAAHSLQQFAGFSSSSVTVDRCGVRRETGNRGSMCGSVSVSRALFCFARSRLACNFSSPPHSAFHVHVLFSARRPLSALGSARRADHDSRKTASGGSVVGRSAFLAQLACNARGRLPSYVSKVSSSVDQQICHVQYLVSCS